MFSAVRHAARRTVTRTPARRALTTAVDATPGDALKHVANPLRGARPTAPSAASSSSLVPPQPAASSVPALRAKTEPAVIHIPPAEDPLLHLFTSCVMSHGKRQQASRVVSRMLLHIHAFTKAPPLPILREAVALASPLLRCRQFKRAAKQYVFPMPLTERQRTRTAIMWMLKTSDEKGAGEHRPERLAREVIKVINGTSDVLKKKEEVHKFAVLHRGNVQRPPRVPSTNRG